MKIVIDIDENVFTRLFDNGTEDYAIANDDLFAIAKAIRKGIPLNNMELNTSDVLYLIASISCMSLIGEGKYHKLVCDYITEKLFKYNKVHNGVPIPDPIHPEDFRFPEDMDEIVLEAVHTYNTEVLEHILHQLKDHAKMEEENT